MARKTKQNHITTPELIKQINSKNTRLLNDFINYMRSIQRSEKTIAGYTNDLQIFFVWNLQNNDNKFFVDISKRDIASFQGYISHDNENSPARIRRIKSAIASLSNYIVDILDEEDEFKNFKKIVNRIENPVNEPVREKTVFTDEQLQTLLDYFINKKQYQKACAVAVAMCSGARKAVAMCSGARKSEIVRYKVSYFKDENIICGSLYKTPEKMITKGRNGGKKIHRFILVKEFKPYFDLWMEQRKELGIDCDYLFTYKDNNSGKWIQMKSDTLNSWAETATRVLGIDFYWHSLRHFYCSRLKRLGLPDDIITEIIGWQSADMVKIYNDVEVDDQLSEYFDENGIKEIKQAKLNDL